MSPLTQITKTCFIENNKIFRKNKERSTKPSLFNLSEGDHIGMRIIGVNIPDNKRIKISLTYIYGISVSTAVKILSASKINKDKRAKDLTSEELNKIQNFIEKNLRVEGELRQIVKSNINRLKEIKSYRGSRHIRNLPVRGQRTKTNSRTVRGNVRKTVGSGRRKTELK